jgi:2,5-dioxopentanoate dehydrogenase
MEYFYCNKLIMLTGKNYIGYTLSAQGDTSYTTQNPATGTAIPQQFFLATLQEKDEAASIAAKAFAVYVNMPGNHKADFLESIAQHILLQGDALIDCAANESGLPAARLIAERGRTITQLQLFAQLLREGSWVNACIETAMPQRQPLPKPDIRRMQTPLGSVVVFGASNFPFAYSAAGGDTASALAAGCPVIVKAHPAHPGTDEMVTQAIISAAKATNMPDGVFSLLHCDEPTAIALVTHAAIRAVGFTGSRKGGMAIYNAAVNRAQPIPVYAEMSAVNPMILLPGAIAADGNSIANGLAASVTLGVGQFCTNPGLVFMIADAATNIFLQTLATAVQAVKPATMLSEGIFNNYASGVDRLKKHHAVTLVAAADNFGSGLQGVAHVFTVVQKDFIADISLSHEVFGPATIIILCKDVDEIKEALYGLDGQLTATIHAAATDEAMMNVLIDVMREKAGRLIYGGFPTGVEVCNAMVHGGPFPATTDSRTTAVGAEAMQRFVRPVCYQNFPQHSLPDELKNDNPLQIIRTINGVLTKEPV